MNNSAFADCIDFEDDIGHHNQLRGWESDEDYPDVDPFRWLVNTCLEEHPMITRNVDIHGGIPTIVGSRIGIDYILDRLVVHGSVRKVANLFEGQIDEEQVREAIAFARDFMEKACDQFEVND